MRVRCRLCGSMFLVPGYPKGGSRWCVACQPQARKTAKGPDSLDPKPAKRKNKG